MKIRFVSACSALLLMFAVSAQAGVYTDELSKCLVSSTSKDDRIALVRWMFAAASAHPAVSSIAATTPQQLDDANRSVGELFMRLTTVSCREQTKNAILYEGQLAIQGGFEVLGQVAGTEMFSSPEVAAGMAGLEKYIDNTKISELVGQ